MSEVEDYIIRELERGFPAAKIVNAMVKNGYEAAKVEQLTKELAKTHGRRALFQKAVLSIEHIFSKKIILLVLIPFYLTLIFFAGRSYVHDRELSTLLVSTMVLVTSVIPTMMIVEQFLLRRGFNHSLHSIGFILLASGLIIFLVSILLRASPLPIGILCLPAMAAVYRKDLGLTWKEAIGVTGISGGAGLMIAFLSFAAFGIIIGILTLIPGF